MITEKYGCVSKENKAKSKQLFRSVCGSFIQPWLAENWNYERWLQELRLMKKAGMKYIIIQSVADLTFDVSKDSGEDSSLYKIESRVCLYPSKLPEFKGVNNGTDSLGNCLKACRQTGMQAILGPISDTRWWKYGWEIPTCPEGFTDPLKDSYFALWIKENADLSNRIVDEIVSLYGEYDEQIFCWYYNNEIWNMVKPCKREDDLIYARMLAESMNLSLRHYSAMKNNKPMLLSSFINPVLSTPQELCGMWKDIFRYTDFREGDIFCPQDSFGNNTTIDLDEWTKCYADAVESKPGLVFWCNNECFRHGGIAPIEDFAGQIETTAKYCEANICFSWNHYYSPAEKHPGYNEAFTYYNTTGKLKKSVWKAPRVTVKNKTVQIETESDSEIRTVEIFNASSPKPVITEKCRDSGEPIKEINVKENGEYYLVTVDFYGNVSERADFRIK